MAGGSGEDRFTGAVLKDSQAGGGGGPGCVGLRMEVGDVVMPEAQGTCGIPLN